MPIKSILCAYSGDTARGAMLRHALHVARHHHAHLTGVLRYALPTLEGRFAAHLPAALRTELRQADARHVAEIADGFRAAVAEAGLTNDAEFVEIDPRRDGALSAFAHAFDLIVTGVHPETANEAHMAASPDALALGSGRPVLVVPDDYDAPGLAERAIVAWDGKRAAARALGDATEVLAEKSHVTLLSVGATPPGTDRMVTNMARHGVRVDARTVARKRSVADTLLAEAAAEDSKLIVMGAFEHSKVSHDLFGGVTTDVIDRSPVPVFMAH